MVLIHAKMGLLGHGQEWDNSREGWSCSVWAVSALGVLMVNTCSHKLQHLCNTLRDAGRIQLENDNFRCLYVFVMSARVSATIKVTGDPAVVAFGS